MEFAKNFSKNQLRCCITVRCPSVSTQNCVGKNGVARYFEILTMQRGIYDSLELLDKRTRFRKVISNVSDIGALWRKIASEKNGVSRYFEILTT